jgi:MoxR-like ATPase
MADVLFRVQACTPYGRRSWMSSPEIPTLTAATSEADLEAVHKLNAAYSTIRGELAKVIVGQDQVIEYLLICIFARGHGLLLGVPGLAKTLMVSTLAQALNLSFSRIQFTPDLMPADITGTEVIQEDKGTGERSFRFLKGPIFSNVILADEINRTPPKTQAALLEAMQERQVTAGGEKRLLPDPFFVLATQNPIEQEGTYPLPEAQLDRFMFEIIVDYPSEGEEFDILRRTTAPFTAELSRVLSAQDIIGLQHLVLKVPIAEHVIRYAMQLARLTRVGKEEVPEFVRRYVRWGAGPRAGQYMILGGKARAVLNGRYYVSTEDIRCVAHAVLRHRIITNFNAEAEGVTTDKLVAQLIEAVPAPEYDVSADQRLATVLK